MVSITVIITIFPGVNREVSIDEIKRAYRKLAGKYHTYYFTDSRKW